MIPTATVAPLWGSEIPDIVVYLVVCMCVVFVMYIVVYCVVCMCVVSVV